MKDNIIILENSENSIILRSISQRDQERLRIWKNKNKEYFFFKEEINSEMQQNWFNKYFTDENNYMFIIEYNNNLVGCIGFKLTPEGADVYNVILGDENFAKHGIMSKAIRIMCSYIFEKGIRRIFLRVLQINDIAYKWYLRNSFNKEYSKQDYHFLELDREKFKCCKIKVIAEEP